MERERALQLLDTAGKTVGDGGDRHRDYGTAKDNFTNIARLWEPILGVEVDATKVALCMAQVKLGRLIHSPAHEDSWIDALGYIALGGSIASPGETGTALPPLIPFNHV